MFPFLGKGEQLSLRRKGLNCPKKKKILRRKGLNYLGDQLPTRSKFLNVAIPKKKVKM
jgi:hypothetical protein